MTCKAAKLMVTMTQTKRAIFNELHNDDTVFVAYGSEDITTVPVDISAGMSCIIRTLLRIPTMFRIADHANNYVHFSSACKGLLSEFQKGGTRTLLEVVQGIALTSHAGSARSNETTVIYARHPSSASGGYVHLHTKLNEMFPKYDDMIEFSGKFTCPEEHRKNLATLLPDCCVAVGW
jgi:hypothetical protein